MKTHAAPVVIRDRGQLADALETELGFYRTLYVLLDRQRDWLADGRDQDVSADFAEVAGLQQQIEGSEQRITAARTSAPDRFCEWTQAPEVVGVVDKITDMVGRCREVVAECERLAGQRLAAYRRELDAMGQGRRLLAGMAAGDLTPRFLDERP